MICSKPVLDGYGSEERWNQLDNVSARPIHSGAVWTLKGQVAEIRVQRVPQARGWIHWLRSVPRQEILDRRHDQTNQQRLADDERRQRGLPVGPGEEVPDRADDQRGHEGNNLLVASSDSRTTGRPTRAATNTAPDPFRLPNCQITVGEPPGAEPHRREAKREPVSNRHPELDT